MLLAYCSWKRKLRASSKTLDGGTETENEQIGRRDPVEIVQAARQGRVIPFPAHSVVPGGRALEWLSAGDGIGVPRAATSVQGLDNQDSECVGQVDLEDSQESDVTSFHFTWNTVRMRPRPDRGL